MVRKRAGAGAGAAQIDDNHADLCARIDDMKLEFSKQFAALEDRVKAVEEKFQNVRHLKTYLSPLQDAIHTSRTSPVFSQDFEDMEERVESVGSRLERIETLLFAIPDLTQLDEAIRHLVSTQAALEGRELRCQTIKPNTEDSRLPELPTFSGFGTVIEDRQQEQGSELQGFWKDQEGTEVEIRGAQLFGPDGGRLDCKILDGSKLSFVWNSETYEAKLDKDRLLWNDGAVWSKSAGTTSREPGAEADR